MIKKIFLLLSVVLISSCSAKSSKNVYYFGDYKPLVNKTFSLTTDPSITISFQKDKVFGQAQVNTFTGSFVVRKTDKIEISDMAITLKSANYEEMKKEREFLTKLMGFKDYSLENGVLKIDSLEFILIK